MVGMPVSLPFTEADIGLAAGARSFERGLEYLDAVQDLRISMGKSPRASTATELLGGRGAEVVRERIVTVYAENRSNGITQGLPST
jgi:hypothetical protein